MLYAYRCRRGQRRPPLEPRLESWRAPQVGWTLISFLFLLRPSPVSRYCFTHVSPIPFPTSLPCFLLALNLAKSPEAL